MNARLPVKLIILLSAFVFAYSLFVVGMRESDNMKLLGCGISLILAASVCLSLLFDLKK